MRLLLLRHAEAAPIKGSDDHGRALTPRGLRDAAAAGTRLKGHGWIPSLALVSDARRTQETFERVALQLPAAPRLMVRADLYDAEPEAILAAIAAVPPATDCLLVIGHNPGLATTVQRLGHAAPEPLRTRLALGFPPAALAVLTLSGARPPAAAGGVLDDLLMP